MRRAIVSDTVRRRWTYDRRRRANRAVARPDDTPDTPPGWERNPRGGGYVRRLPRCTLTLHPAGGLWFWSRISQDGGEARYSRAYHRFQDALAAALRVVAEVETECPYL
jgi:hypothetical protein